MISDGKINMIVDLRADTVADNFFNEIGGFKATKSKLPSDDLFAADKIVKKLPRGID